MKTSALLIAASVASASAFAPASRTPQSTQLNESLFKKLSNMDLWAPVADSNDYGARGKKASTTTGKLTDRSYVPSGLTKSQYESIRSNADKKKAANYEKNVKKAFKFQDYTEFYMKRGSDENGSWLKLPNLGHDMAKTKYDWSGETVRILSLFSDVYLFAISTSYQFSLPRYVLPFIYRREKHPSGLGLAPEFSERRNKVPDFVMMGV